MVLNKNEKHKIMCASPFNPSEKIKLQICKKELAINRSDVVIDLGCGIGRYSSELAKFAGKVIGMDLSLDSIRLAKQLFRLKNCDFICCDATHIPVKDSSIDKVSSVDVLEHIQDDNAVLDEIDRVLKPRRRIFLYVPCRNAFSLEWVDAKAKGTYPMYPIDIETGHVHRYKTKEILSLLESVGFNQSSVKIRYFGHYAVPLLENLSFKVGRKFISQGAENSRSLESYREYSNRLVQFSLFIVRILEYFDVLLERIPTASGMFIIIK